jgi:hypothetical protein
MGKTFSRNTTIMPFCYHLFRLVVAAIIASTQSFTTPASNSALESAQAGLKLTIGLPISSRKRAIGK